MFHIVFVLVCYKNCIDIKKIWIAGHSGDLQATHVAMMLSAATMQKPEKQCPAHKQTKTAGLVDCWSVTVTAACGGKTDLPKEDEDCRKEDATQPDGAPQRLSLGVKPLLHQIWLNDICCREQPTCRVPTGKLQASVVSTTYIPVVTNLCLL